jgi:predicted GNAT family acetyltransferase
MRATRLDSAEAFAERVAPFLAAHEAEHNLALGLLGRLHAEPRLYGFDPAFVVVEESGAVAGCLLRTPPHGVVLSRFTSADAVDAAAGAVLDMHPGLPGAVGPVAVTERFAQAWSAATGASTSIAIRERIHAAAEVRDLPRAAGVMRQAGEDDVGLLVEWLVAFAEEALPDAPHVEDAEATYRRRAGDPAGAWLVWDDKGPVSLAAYGSPTPMGTRVGPVYTPPEFRGRGYATSLVAELTAERLAAGLAFCVLFTDLSNPTSNEIYARIGYEPVADWDQWRFDAVQG